MIAVIFEVEPAEGRRDAYLGLAAELRPLLDGIDGFISIERFQSLADPGRVLSLSFWRDEEAVRAEIAPCFVEMEGRRTDIVVLAVPFVQQAAALDAIAPALSGPTTSAP